MLNIFLIKSSLQSGWLYDFATPNFFSLGLKVWRSNGKVFMSGVELAARLLIEKQKFP